MKKQSIPFGTYTVIAICVTVYLLQTILGYTSVEGQILFGAYYKPFIIAGEYWRLLTVGFVHAGVLHLFMNMVSLYLLGRVVERIVGTTKFLLILFLSTIGGSLFVFIGQGNVVNVGLSGGIYGILAAFIYILIKTGAFRMPQTRMAIIEMVGINLVLNFMPNVAWLGHLGGAVTGLFLAAIVLPFSAKLSSQRIHFIIAGLVFVIGLLVLTFKSSTILSDEVYLKSDYNILFIERKILPQGYIDHISQNLDNLYGTGTMLYDALRKD